MKYIYVVSIRYDHDFSLEGFFTSKKNAKAFIKLKQDSIAYSYKPQIVITKHLINDVNMDFYQEEFIKY